MGRNNMFSLISDYENLDDGAPNNNRMERSPQPGKGKKAPANTKNTVQKAPQPLKTNKAPITTSKNVTLKQPVPKKTTVTNTKTNTLKPPSNTQPKISSNKNIKTTNIQQNKSDRQIGNSTSGRGFKELTHDVIKSYLSAKNTVSDITEKNITDVLVGGLKKIVESKDLEVMQQKGQNYYIEALQNKLVNNEQNFVVLDCNANQDYMQEFHDEDWVDTDFMEACKEDYEWKELPNLGYSDISQFKDVSSANVTQGNLGDCWLISSIGVLANSHLDFVMRLLKCSNPKIPKVVEAWICQNGKFKKIFLDQFFPAGDHGFGGTKFVRPGANKEGSWQMFLEKAFAKSYRGYRQLDGGHSSIAFSDLTGAPSEYTELDNLNEAWCDLVNNLKKGYLVTGYSQGQINKLDPKCQIEPGHCYGILELCEVTYNKNLTRFILLKNPNGGSDTTNGRPMNEELKVLILSKSGVQLNSDDSSGLFWLSLGDFKKTFDSYTICKLRQKYCSSALEIKNNDSSKDTFLFKGTGIKGTHAYVTLLRDNVRFSKEKIDQDYGKVKYGVSRIVIFQIKNQSIEIIGNAFHSKQTATTEIKVDNEEFFIYVECDYYVKGSLDLTISCYSSKPVLVEYLKKETEKLQADKNKELLTALIGSYALKNKKVENPQELKEYSSKTGGACKRYYGEMLGFVAFVYFNNGSVETLSEEYTVKELRNVEWFFPWKKGDMTKKAIKLKPGEVKITILKFGWANNCGHSSRISTGAMYK